MLLFKRTALLEVLPQEGHAFELAGHDVDSELLLESVELVLPLIDAEEELLDALKAVQMHGLGQDLGLVAEHFGLEQGADEV